MSDINHIIKQSIEGDRTAQRSLYELYRTRWYMISMRYGKNASQADDILQEGLIRIFKDLHQYDKTRSQFSTWSSRLGVNAALRYLKKHNWEYTFSENGEGIQIEDQAEIIYAKLAAQELTAMIQKLPMGYRIVFNMYCVEGYSHKEIANELGISQGTSKSQLSKARRHMRNLLEKQLSEVSNG